MLKWNTFKPGRLYVFADFKKDQIGGFISRGKGDPLWKALGPSTELSPGGLPDSFYHHHPIYGEFDSLEEAKAEVEARSRSGDFSSETEELVDVRHV